MKTIAIVKYVFAAVGVALLAGAFLWWQSVSAFVAGAARAQGTVVDLIASRSSDSTTYRPEVRFTAPGGRVVQFISGAGSNPPGYSRGESVEVLFEPSRPDKAMVNGFFSLWGGPLIVGGLGGVFFLVGAAILVATRLAGQRSERLRMLGTPVQANFQQVELNESLRVNGAHPFRIVAQWQDPATSQVHVFRSANLWFDPSDYLKSKTLTVYVDPADPRKYLLDTSFLPKLAG